MDHIRKTFLDASALIAWLLHPDKPEPGGERLSEYLRRPKRQPYSNNPCLTEVLTRLKWMRYHKEITDAGYFMRIDLLKTRIDHRTLHISEFNYWKKEYMDRALELVKKHQTKIDYVDALQIVDILEGPFNVFSGPSRILLVSTDRALVVAARAEGVDAWFPPERD